jgi:hypothetical protein
MRLFFWACLYRLATAAEHRAAALHRLLFLFRNHVWDRTTRENLRTCRIRQQSRDLFQ